MTAPAPSPVAAFLAETGALIRQLDAIAPAGPPRFDDEDVNEIIAAQGRLAGRVQPLLAALEAVLELHRKQDKPVKVTTLCPGHRPGTARYRIDPSIVSTCPDCAVTEVEVCAHCQCPHDEWPCLTYRAVEAALCGAQGGAG